MGLGFSRKYKYDIWQKPKKKKAILNSSWKIYQSITSVLWHAVFEKTHEQ